MLGAGSRHKPAAIDDATVEALRTINRRLAGVATNINQIAHSANRTHDPDYRAFMAQRAELGRILIETRGALQRILISVRGARTGSRG